MREGTYTVQFWNGKDGTLIDDKGEYLLVSKIDLSPEFREFMVVGEKVCVKLVLTLDPFAKAHTEDEKARAQFLQARKQQQLIEQENQYFHELRQKEIQRQLQYGFCDFVRKDDN